MHGFGIYTWPDGRRYEGNYQYNKKEGEGIYIAGDKSIFEGLWL